MPIDVVASCGFIDDKTSEKLIEKHKGMVSRHQAEKLKRHLYLPRAGTRQDYYTAIEITDTINAGEKIFFQYSGYGEKIHTVSPYAVVCGGSHFYVRGLSAGGGAVERFCIDRMSNIGMAHEKAVPQPEDVSVEVILEFENAMMGGGH